jgi:hypothetical protein
MRRCLFALFSTALLATPAAAEEQEFRRMNLNDGRELMGIVLESTATGMKLRVPQGTVVVGYEKLSDMATIDMGAWMAQPAARIAVAPAAVLDEEVRSLANDTDQWLPKAVGVVPRAAVIGPADWGSSLGAQKAELALCSGDVECLRGLLVGMEVDYLIVPTLKPGPPNRLSLLGVVASTGVMLGTAEVALTSTAAEPGRVDMQHSGEPAARALFDALGFAPDVDIKAAVAAVFPPPAVAAAATPAATPAAAPTVATASTRPAPSRAVSIALGFAPVPGLASAYLRDGPGFVVSLVGTVGASWGTIYGVGTVARTADAFWAPNILVPYAINVVFNQVATAIGWRRLYAGRTAAHIPTPTAMPLADGGFSLGVAGRF